jgi:uncharacterized protein (TIGR00251 family)
MIVDYQARSKVQDPLRDLWGLLFNPLPASYNLLMVTRRSVRVTPNAKSNQIIAISQGTVRIKVRAVAKDGKANAELISFLTNLLDCHRSQVEIIKGEKTRNKLLEIRDSDPEEISRKLKKTLADGGAPR